MRVELIHYTPIAPLIEACNMPYQSKGSEKLVGRVWDSGHRSIARHSVAVFKVTDVSQSLLRQISRHPHINITAKSSRYCNMEGSDIYVPNEIRRVKNKYVEYQKDMANIMQIYSKWKRYEEDKKEGDISKLFLPLGSTTDLIISGNYQALYEFLQLRLCVRSEWEIRKVAEEMTRQLVEVVPVVFKDLDCKGKELKYCPEHEACGKYPRKE